MLSPKAGGDEEAMKRKCLTHKRQAVASHNIHKASARKVERLPLHQIVWNINDRLIDRGLPEWLINASDKDLKRRAAYCGKYEDYMNVPGSCLFLCMIKPRDFGLDAQPLPPGSATTKP